MLHECRSRPNTGIISTLPNISNLVEIDVSKAYSACFGKINRIPLFNIFDKWEGYEGETLRKFSLYVVESNEFNTFFNKPNNLCYGQRLKYFPREKLTIKYVKKPSWVIPVKKHKAMIEELFETELSDDEDENRMLQKTTANTVIGL